jgi:hypothetical protein
MTLSPACHHDVYADLHVVKLLWIFGFTDSHRFYCGTIWFFTLGLLGIGWIYDFCTINRQVDERKRVG